MYLLKLSLPLSLHIYHNIPCIYFEKKLVGLESNTGSPSSVWVVYMTVGNDILSQILIFAVDPKETLKL